MIGLVIRKLFGTQNARYIKSLQPQIQKINALEPQFKELADEDFAKKIASWKIDVQEKKVSLDSLLPEVFALVREASTRILSMRHYDVQLIGGMVLHHGKIAEMKTGEGKTLVATLAVVLNALAGKGVHVVTVNDYLAQRDAEWMGKLYSFLGLSVGVIVHGLDDEERKANYDADITYGTNNEFGFDYLRDNMKFYPEHLVQRPPFFSIVDEVDSILIDEARTPLIISGPAEKSASLYLQIDNLIPSLVKEEDFTVDEKSHSVSLTDDGIGKCEQLLNLENLFDPTNISVQHHILQALRAHHLYTKDDHYIVQDDQVLIVDEFTGRLMPGRRFGDGLHQALEAKERVNIQAENQTLATITFQNYFRMYDKLSGMTGTADTEAVEFDQIYGLEVIIIPPNKHIQRKDFADVVYRTQEEKYEAIIEEIVTLSQSGQPVLVGTTSIEKSEYISNILTKRKIKHEVLNAKQHEREAEIIAMAGQKGRITIATNMAGRGTDIVLGDDVCELGGLHILGTERHESRRIDNQLRGRAGRQGDPGSSRFYLSMEDTLLRLFGSERMQSLMNKMGMKHGDSIEHGLLSKLIENAQRKVEGHNFEIRKQLLDYDDVMNQQREVIYSLRREIIIDEHLEPVITEYLDDVITETFSPIQNKNSGFEKSEACAVVNAKLTEIFGMQTKETEIPTEIAVKDFVWEKLNAIKDQVDEKTYQSILRYFLLDSLDRNWKENLLSMDYLKEGIGLRGYGQLDPKQEYKKEGFALFQVLLFAIKEQTFRVLCRLKLENTEATELKHEEPKVELQHSNLETDVKKQTPIKRSAPKVGRNDLCSCGSGKKSKRCCG